MVSALDEVVGRPGRSLVDQPADVVGELAVGLEEGRHIGPGGGAVVADENHEVLAPALHRSQLLVGDPEDAGDHRDREGDREVVDEVGGAPADESVEEVVGELLDEGLQQLHPLGGERPVDQATHMGVLRWVGQEQPRVGRGRDLEELRHQVTGRFEDGPEPFGRQRSGGVAGGERGRVPQHRLRGSIACHHERAQGIRPQHRPGHPHGVVVGERAADRRARRGRPARRRP